MIIANLEEKNNTSDKLVMNKVKKKEKKKNMLLLRREMIAKFKSLKKLLSVGSVYCCTSTTTGVDSQIPCFVQ
jgi:hypothetical protein